MNRCNLWFLIQLLAHLHFFDGIGVFGSLSGLMALLGLFFVLRWWMGSIPSSSCTTSNTKSSFAKDVGLDESVGQRPFLSLLEDARWGPSLCLPAQLQNAESSFAKDMALDESVGQRPFLSLLEDACRDLMMWRCLALHFCASALGCPLMGLYWLPLWPSNYLVQHVAYSFFCLLKCRNKKIK